jgi:hypothetical protein
MARLTWDGETIALRAPPCSVRRGPRARRPGAFLQATAEGEAALLAAVREAIGPARRVIDLFAGRHLCPAAGRNAEVHAVEGDAALTPRWIGAARRHPGPEARHHRGRDLFRRPLLPDELRGFDAVVIDPPRAGAEAQTPKALPSKTGRAGDRGRVMQPRHLCPRCAQSWWTRGIGSTGCRSSINSAGPACRACSTAVLAPYRALRTIRQTGQS